jgi:truncated hemoglobin YjbI
MIGSLYVPAFLVVLSAAYLGNLLAWTTVWLWRKARHDKPADQAGRESWESRGQQVRVVEKPDGTATLEPISTQDHPTPPKIHPATVLAGPPMVGQHTLRDWAIHYTQRPDVWMGFTRDFYDAAAADPVVLQVFVDAAAARGTEPTVLVEEVQKHFHRALIMLTHKGLTERLAQTLEERHAHLGLTADVYDRTVTALVKTATNYGVPQEAMATLVEMISILQPRLVTA